MLALLSAGFSVELDIYIPELHLAFEYQENSTINRFYWVSDLEVNVYRVSLLWHYQRTLPEIMPASAVSFRSAVILVVFQAMAIQVHRTGDWQSPVVDKVTAVSEGVAFCA